MIIIYINRIIYSICVQGTWMLLSSLAIVLELLTIYTNYPLSDMGLLIVLTLTTLLLMYIEFDRKIFLRLIYNHRFLIILLIVIMEIVVVLILIINVNNSQMTIEGINQLFWIIGIIYMIFMDGTRKLKWYYRTFVYIIYILRSIIMISRTWWDWIDQNIFPNAKEYLISNPSMRIALDDMTRWGWLHIFNVAFISIIYTCWDTNYVYFIMFTEPLSRTGIEFEITRLQYMNQGNKNKISSDGNAFYDNSTTSRVNSNDSLNDDYRYEISDDIITESKSMIIFPSSFNQKRVMVQRASSVL